jgi:DNA polymerase-3 subunit alpha
MNALYRPGPIAYIPSFIKRKRRRNYLWILTIAKTTFKRYLRIVVYQEQVMLLSQKLADFSKGDAAVFKKSNG